MRCDRPPWLGPATGSGVQGERIALVGPITPKAIFIRDRKQQNYIPIYVSGIYSHSKTSKLNIIYNNPCPREHQSRKWHCNPTTTCSMILVYPQPNQNHHDCCDSGSPRLGLAAGRGVQRETVALVGPITPKAQCYRMETTDLYRCYRISDIQSLKDR